MPLTAGGSDLRTREETQTALLALLAAAEPRLSRAGARLRLGFNSADYSDTAAEMEGYARLLWGVAPLVAGGYDYPQISRLAEGLAAGTDPSHPEFWGVPDDFDQRFVEAAAIAYALCMAPERLWSPLSSGQRSRVAEWLTIINRRTLCDNNWLFFRVLVNVALKKLGEAHDAERIDQDLTRLDSFYASDGWYADGREPRFDYYNSFVLHFYGLLLTRFAGYEYRDWSTRFIERAGRFAEEFVYWFAPDGAAVPYGRSLSYRFGQAAFWSALALCDLYPIPCGVVKGIILRHLRWWLSKAIFDEAGLLTVGYAYPNQGCVEQYVSPASPYWALKTFAVLALPASGRFWEADEQPLPRLEAIRRQPTNRAIACRHSAHVFVLAGGQPPCEQRNSASKYSKFCYSSQFGFSMPVSDAGLAFLAPDNTLLLSDDSRGQWWRGRRGPERVETADNYVISVWRPWQGVKLTTWLIAAPPWHLRLHRLSTDRLLLSVEGGFALNCDSGGLDRAASPGRKEHLALVEHGSGLSLIRDESQIRTGLVIQTSQTNVLWPRTIIPAVAGAHCPGDHWLACAVYAHSGDGDAASVAVESGPRFRMAVGVIEALASDGTVMLSIATGDEF